MILIFKMQRYSKLVKKRFHLVQGKKVSPFTKVNPLNHLPQRQRREMFVEGFGYRDF